MQQAGFLLLLGYNVKHISRLDIVSNRVLQLVPRMNLSSPILCLHAALASALHKDLLPVEHQVPDYDAIAKARKKGQPEPGLRERPYKLTKMRPREDETETILFPQTWGSTALGYGGMGGAAITTAYTVVVRTRASACVYFGQSGRLAYLVNLQDCTEEQRKAFIADLHSHNLCGRRDAVERYGVENPKPRDEDS